jgi:hypothetical protein
MPHSPTLQLEFRLRELRLLQIGLRSYCHDLQDGALVARSERAQRMDDVRALDQRLEVAMRQLGARVLDQVTTGMRHRGSGTDGDPDRSTTTTTEITS